MSRLHRAALPALGAALLFGASTPFAKQLIGDSADLSFPFLLAGLLYLGSGAGLALTRLIRNQGWAPVHLSRQEWPWLLGAIGFGGVLGPLLLMVGLSRTTAATASLFLNLESVLTACLAWMVFKESTDRRAADGLFIKLQKAGGILKSQRWLTMARLSGLPVHCGCMIGSGLEHSPAAHLWTANDWATQGLNESIGPLMIHGTMESKNIAPGTDIALNIPRFEAGMCYPNEGLGFGIELNDSLLVRNRTADKDARTVAL